MEMSLIRVILVLQQVMTVIVMEVMKTAMDERMKGMDQVRATVVQGSADEAEVLSVRMEV